MKKIKFISILGVLCLLWVLIILKTVQLSESYDPIYYFGIMLENTFQAHFNVDLLIHSILLGIWIFYRQKSKIVAIFCGFLAIYFGIMFTLIYIIVIFIRSKGDLTLFFQGKRN